MLASHAHDGRDFGVTTDALNLLTSIAVPLTAAALFCELLQLKMFIFFFQLYSERYFGLLW